MNNSKRIATGFVGAAIMCATNTIVVHAEEAPVPTTVNVPTEPGQEQPKLQLLNASSSSSSLSIVDKMQEIMETSPAMKLGDYSSTGKSKEFISQFKKEAQFVGGSQGSPDLEGKKEFDFTQSNPAVKIAPDAKERLFKTVPSAFVDPSGNSVLNLTVESPAVATELSVEDAKKYGWTKPDVREEEKWGETTTVTDYNNPIVDLPRFYFDISADPNKIQFKVPSEQGFLDKDGNEKPVTAIMTRITKGESIIGNRGNYLRVTESANGFLTEPGSGGRYAYGVSEMFNAGEYFEYEMPVEYSSKADSANGGYAVTAPAKIVIDRRQEYGTPRQIDDSNGMSTVFIVPVKNTGNVAVGGYKITAPDGTVGKLGGGKEVLQPGESGELRVAYTPKPGEKVNLKVSASNQAEKTINAATPELQWADALTFAGKQVSDKTPLRVKPNTQLLFQAGVKNTGTGSATSFDVTLPNGKKTTINQEVKAGESTTVKIPYTPGKDETKLTFKISSNGQFQKTYTATIQQETPQPTTENKPAPSTGTPDTPAPKPTSIPNLGTLIIKEPVELGGTFRLPFEQITNKSNDRWGRMYVVSEDGKYVQSLDDGDAVVAIEPGSSFPSGISIPNFKPSNTKQYTGEEKPKLTLYKEVPSSIKTLETGKKEFIEDFGTPVGTFDIEIPDLITEIPNFFAKTAVKVGDEEVKEINALPGQNIYPNFVLEMPDGKEAPKEGLRVVGDNLDSKIEKSGGTYGPISRKDVKIEAPEGKEKDIRFTIKPRGSDLSYNTTSVKVRNVTKDDSKVPQVKTPVEVTNDIVRARPGDKIEFKVKDLIKDQTIREVYDADGNSYTTVPGVDRIFTYEVKEEDFKAPKKFYIVDTHGVVTGKMVLKFDEDFNKSMISLKGGTVKEGHYGQKFKQEITVRNLTTRPMNKVELAYETLGKRSNGAVPEKKFDIPLEKPLNPGETATVSVDIEPEIRGLDTYQGQFRLRNTGSWNDVDRTDTVTFKLSPRPLENGENPFKFVGIENNTMTIWPDEPVRHTVKSELGRRFPVQIISPNGDVIERESFNEGNPDQLVYETDIFTFEYTPTQDDIEKGSATFKFVDKSTGEVIGGQTVKYKTNVDSERYTRIKVPARFETNLADPVSVKVDLSRGFEYEVKNTGSSPMVNVEVFDKLINSSTDEVIDLNPVPVDETFNRTLLPGQRVAFRAELPEGLDPSVEYTNSAQSIGHLPQRPKRGRAIAGEPDYGEDPSSVLIISPRENLKGNAHIIVDDGDPIDPSKQYRRAEHPEDVVISKDDANYSRTYKNPDGTIITITPDEIIFKPNESGKEYFRHRTGKHYLEFHENGEYKTFEIDYAPVDELFASDPSYAGNNAPSNFYTNGEFGIQVNGLGSIRHNFPYITHNMADFYENVTGATESDAKKRIAENYMMKPASENSAFVTNGNGLVMSAASAQSKGPGTYEEEIEVFDQATFAVEKVKISYTIHPDGTATVNFIDAPEGMEFDVELYRPSEDGDDVYVDEQGRTHDGSGDPETAAERLKNRQVEGENDQNGSGTANSESTDKENSDSEENSDSSITDRARGVLAATGISSGAVGAALLALVSLLGAIMVVRRGGKKN